MSLLSESGLILGAYLAAGRVGCIATCLLLGIAPLKTLIIAIMIDVVQLPVYGILLEFSFHRVLLPERLTTWLKRMSQSVKERMDRKSYWRYMLRVQPLAVIGISIIPIRGFGIFTASVLAFFLGYRRVKATVLIMTGSSIGSVLSILILFFPARWISGL